MGEPCASGYPVILRGGTLAGETMILQNLREPYRAPVYGGPIQSAGSYEAAMLYAKEIQYDVETYKWCGERDQHGNFVMRWENPVPALRSLLAEAEDKLARIRRVANV